MNGILPDKWSMVVAYRSRKFGLESLKNLRAKKMMLETCEECPALRTEFIMGGIYDYVFFRCIFYNKCIKQYPHRIDNKEFK
jgi:hypothetical protein